MVVKNESGADKVFRWGDRTRIVFAIVASVVTLWVTYPTAVALLGDTFGWTRPAVIVSKQIECDLATGDCTGIPLIKKVRDDCETTRIGFSGYAARSAFSAVRVGQARNITRTPDSDFISFIVPYKLAAPFDDIGQGKYAITAGGVSYLCKGRPQYVEFPLKTVMIDNLQYHKTYVVFYDSTKNRGGK